MASQTTTHPFVSPIMPIAFIAALFFTVVLLVITAYSLLGSMPLLVLQHDTPLDSRFIRGFFDNYYRVAIFVASATAVSYAFAGRLVFAAGAAGVALLATILRRKLIPKMDSLRARIQNNETTAIPGFRRVHLAAILVNLAQLVFIVGSLITLSMQMR